MAVAWHSNICHQITRFYAKRFGDFEKSVNGCRFFAVSLPSVGSQQQSIRDRHHAADHYFTFAKTRNECTTQVGFETYGLTPFGGHQAPAQAAAEMPVSAGSETRTTP
jgi:hypothetical protein